MTTIYLIRHSKPLKVNNYSNKDSFQIQNEKSSLSIEGESIAREKMNNKELSNIDTIYSSNYVRAIQTAKYLAEKNNLEINVDSELGERKFGIDSWDELPEGFEKKLEAVGVGYRFALKGNKLVITAGFSHPVEVDIPEGIKLESPSNTELFIRGIDKCQVGEYAAKIRKIRMPEPYKGKGIRYAGEIIRRKVGKKAA